VKTFNINNETVAKALDGFASLHWLRISENPLVSLIEASFVVGLLTTILVVKPVSVLGICALVFITLEVVVVRDLYKEIKAAVSTIEGEDT